jgi:REP element-mobilizing transposase RayT
MKEMPMDEGLSLYGGSSPNSDCDTAEVCDASALGYIKGKSAIHIAWTQGERKRNFVGQHFRARGYCEFTVGRDEAMTREYIRHQEQEDLWVDQS